MIDKAVEKGGGTLRKKKKTEYEGKERILAR